jgi:arginase
MEAEMVGGSRRWTCLGVPIDSVGAPDGGPPFGTEAAPAALRARGLVDRLGATDRGDLPVRVTGPRRDPTSGVVGWPSVATMTTEVRIAVAGMVGAGERPLLLGGCCALVMGAAAGLRDAVGRVGLVSADGHVDVYDHRTSPTGEAADMPLAALSGLGWPGLLDTLGPLPVVDGHDIVVLGARDAEEAVDIGDLPARLGISVHGGDEVAADPDRLGRRTSARFADSGVPYWLHLDVDVLDQDAFPATDYLMPGRLDLDGLTRLLRPLGADPLLLGASVGCYNPSKDPDGVCGAGLADLLVDVLAR